MPPKFLNVVTADNATIVSDSDVRISFDAKELELFSFLRDVVQAYEESKIGSSLQKHSIAYDEPLIVRIAGGWVRDKLLNIYSDDIDIAVNHFTGVQFAQLMQEYNEISPQAISMSSMGIVAANPAQSKHLETVCMKLAEIDVDICHLRSQEVYTENSRIPEVEFGSPQDDAERRDFTINSLFYNIHTNRVEDWTGRGWEDIQNGLIVTPLDPRTTFLDDPLRVLRAIRFAVRYGYNLTCRSTIQKPEVRKAFATKVSRERVGKELEGMLSGKRANPGNAIKAIHELHLSSLVFMIPDECTALTDVEWNTGLEYLSRVPKFLESLPDQSKVDLRLLPLLSYLLPLHNRLYKTKNKERPLIEYILKESIKFKARDAQAAVTTFSVLDRMLQLLGQETYERRIMGLILRDAKEMWGTALILVALLRNDDRYITAYDKLKELDGCWNAKPLLDGKELIRELGIQRGPDVGIAMQTQVEWMLEHPGATKDSFIEYMRQKRKRQAEEALPK